MMGSLPELDGGRAICIAARRGHMHHTLIQAMKDSPEFGVVVYAPEDNEKLKRVAESFRNAVLVNERPDENITNRIIECTQKEDKNMYDLYDFIDDSIKKDKIEKNLKSLPKEIQKKGVTVGKIPGSFAKRGKGGKKW